MVRGIKVHARKPSKTVGATTGGERSCQLEGCGGRQIAVRWPNGKLTWCCTEGMVEGEKSYRIRV